MSTEETHQVRLVNMSNQKEVCDNVVLELINSQRSLVITEDKFNAIVLHIQNPEDYVDPKFKHWVKSKRFQLMDFPTMGLTNVLVIPKAVAKKEGEIQYKRVVHCGQLYDVMKHVHEDELNHGGHQKCDAFIHQHYYGVTRSYIEAFCNTCQVCDQLVTKSKRRQLKTIRNFSPSSEGNDKLSLTRAGSKKFQRAAVWSFFHMTDDRLKTVCNLCHVELAYSQGTSSMRNHLKFVHKDVQLQSNPPPKKKYKVKGDCRRENPLTSATGVPSTSGASASTSRIEITGGDADNNDYSVSYDSVTSSIAMMCIRDLLPIATIEGPGFLELMRSLKTDFNVADKRVVILYLLVTQSRVKQLVIREVDESPVVISAERWESRQGTKFLSMNGHFITDDWNLENRLFTTATVADNNNADASVLVQLETLAEEFKLENIIALVDIPGKQIDTNNTTQSTLIQVQCYAETLHSVLKQVLELLPLEQVVLSANRLVQHFRYSPAAMAALQENQRQWDSENVQLHQDSSLLWNATCNLLAAVLKLRFAIQAILEDESITKPSDAQYLDINEEFWDILEAAVPILEPLAEAIEILSKQEMPSLSAIYVLLHRIMADLKESDDDSDVVTLLKEKLVSSLCSALRIDSSGVPTDDSLLSPAMVAAVLDPRFKSLKFLPVKKREIVYNHLKNLAEKCTIQPASEPGEVPDPDSSQLQSPPSKKRLLDCLQGDIELTQGSPSEEVVQYLSEPVRTAHPLQWWKEHRKRFPAVAQLARRYLAIPATSRSYDLAFSESGLNIARKRGDLEAEAVDPIMFLHRNHGYLKDLDSVSEMPSQIAVKVSTESTSWPSVLSLASVKTEVATSTSLEETQEVTTEEEDTANTVFVMA